MRRGASPFFVFATTVDIPSSGLYLTPSLWNAAPSVTVDNMPSRFVSNTSKIALTPRSEGYERLEEEDLEALGEQAKIDAIPAASLRPTYYPVLDAVLFPAMRVERDGLRA